MGSGQMQLAWDGDSSGPPPDGGSSGRAPRNRTLDISEEDIRRLRPRLRTAIQEGEPALGNTILHGDCLAVASKIPAEWVDLLVLDPPYNLTKEFNGRTFSKTNVDCYTSWFDSVVSRLKHVLKPTASVYVCGDWLTSVSIFRIISRHFVVRNRITWEREKGRGAKSNWKNNSEDIWFCTASDRYTFNADAVKLRRRVIAPYTNPDGSPKDWQLTPQGGFRDTCPSNLWTDITVPFWSMPENTDHPTQKSEKLVAKLVLASTNPGDTVFDPFLGSGTTAVVAKKLGRNYFGIELDEDYCLLAERRLELADTCQAIQGVLDGVFWERNARAGADTARTPSVAS
ncbi:MAG: DNA-methyltransferase [Chloroflexota bacterium]